MFNEKHSRDDHPKQFVWCFDLPQKLSYEGADSPILSHPEPLPSLQVRVTNWEVLYVPTAGKAMVKERSYQGGLYR